ncbi:glycoside hydrolase family 3 protein [Pseudoalteromonas sp. SSDWG2]|uniref:glycoside hydrolase family 3 protein n=1 Tax=Pseudoalteromonas sp. SSDWG2 TaxID=3139391 RepID=UPI003BAC029C
MSVSALAKPTPSLEEQIGQKLMLDFRYYCDQPQGSQDKCLTPMTSLPTQLAELITKYNIGGVILFAENIDSIEQTVKLNLDLQAAAKASSLGAPLFISVDQEGGRVARIPRNLGTAMTGNMSIGATYAQHGTDFARLSAKVIAKELNALGINVNYAPTVDVNMNPNNPVINVRSFGENPALVAELGGAQVQAYQQNQVIAALKHFPGHGDTSVDSHTGLPLVEHDKAQVMSQDIAPFKAIIDQGNAPGMIMTAHIQYPALDNSTFVSKDGQTMVKPATMSRAIMTDLLRNELGYQGVTITDALDMAGISHFFNAKDALINTFKAGVDIALMPMEIRNQDDIKQFDALIQDVIAAIKNEELSSAEVAHSAERILALKNRFPMLAQYTDVSKQSTLAKRVVGNSEHRDIEAQLAQAAITNVKNAELTPALVEQATNIVLVMPDTRKCMALEQALVALGAKNKTFTCISLQGYSPQQANQALADADLVIAANASPAQSAVEIGGMDDVAALQQYSLDKKQQPKALANLMRQAQQQGIKQIFVSLRAPYDIAQFGHYGDAILATYAYNIDVDDGNTVQGPAFSALAQVLTGKVTAQGQLPVTIDTATDSQEHGQ